MYSFLSQIRVKEKGSMSRVSAGVIRKEIDRGGFF